MDRRKMHQRLFDCLGKAIQARRQKMNMSQEELSQESGVDRAYISRVEQGQRNPSVGAIASIAQALRMRFSRLVVISEECIERSDRR